MTKLQLIYVFAVVALLGFFVIIYMMGSLLSAPSQTIIGMAPSDLPVEVIKIKTKRGNQLSGWLIPNSLGKGAVILFHGVRSSRVQMYDRAKFLHKAGYSVLLFDFQAHGESSGERITFGHLESDDAIAAYNYLRQRLPNDKIAALGVSLGGAAILLSEVAKKADALILESVYSNLEAAIGNRLAIRLGDLGRYFTSLLILQIKPRLGFDPKKLSPIDHIDQVSAPVYILAGALDQHTLLAETQQFYDLAPKPKKLWILPDAAHVDLHAHSPVAYEQRILDFLEDHL